MIMNGDVFLGEGFGALFARDRFGTGGDARFKVYALSRYELPSPFCVEKRKEHCQARANISSLDAFLFRSPLPFNLSANPEELQIKQNTWGAENTLVEVLREKGAVIKNPCHLLQIAHMHCDGRFRPNVRFTVCKVKIVTHWDPLIAPRSKGHTRERPRSKYRRNWVLSPSPTLCRGVEERRSQHVFSSGKHVPLPCGQ